MGFRSGSKAGNLNVACGPASRASVGDIDVEVQESGVGKFYD